MKKNQIFSTLSMVCFVSGLVVGFDTLHLELGFLQMIEAGGSAWFLICNGFLFTALSFAEPFSTTVPRWIWVRWWQALTILIIGIEVLLAIKFFTTPPSSTIVLWVAWTGFAFLCVGVLLILHTKRLARKNFR